MNVDDIQTSNDPENNYHNENLPFTSGDKQHNDCNISAKKTIDNLASCSMTKHKKKDKKRKHRNESHGDDDSDDRTGRTKKKTKSKTRSVVKQQQPQVPAAYVEDVTSGMEGIKRTKPTAKFSHSVNKTWSIGGGGAISSTTKASICKLRVDNEEENRRLQRMQRFGNVATSNDEDDDAEQRLFKALSSSRERGQQTVSLGSGPKVRKGALGENDNNVEPLVGKSQSLEKSYLRLTSDPKPEDVRPLPVLRRALLHIRSQYVEMEDFEWANDQLKAVRQDLTVQHIQRDPLILDVYETHARLLLEHGDLNEFNQCQTMIRSLTNPMFQQPDQDQDQYQADQNLTRRNHRGKGTDVPLLQQSEQSRDEFAAYGLLYSLVQRSAGDIILMLSYFTRLAHHFRVHQNGRNDAANPSNPDSSPAFRHAVQVVKAVIHNDYHTFFRLYECAPHMSGMFTSFREIPPLFAYTKEVAPLQRTSTIIQTSHTFKFTCFSMLCTHPKK